MPTRVVKELKNPRNEIYVSAVSFWEISIKTKIKKLDLEGVAVPDLILIAKTMDFQCIDFTAEEASTYVNLQEETHTDPFDRIREYPFCEENVPQSSREIT